MKQVIGTFMVLVMVFVVVAMALGEEVADISATEGYELLRDWAKSEGWDDWYNEVSDGKTIYGCGVVSKQGFENQSSMDWSIENLKIFYKNEMEYDVQIKQVGTCEGINIYLMEAQSQTKVVASIYNDETNDIDSYYYGSVLFIVCR